MGIRFTYRAYMKAFVFIAESGSREDFHDVREWCTEQFGPRHFRWEEGTIRGCRAIVIGSSNDAFAFRMRWY